MGSEPKKCDSLYIETKSELIKSNSVIYDSDQTLRSGMKGIRNLDFPKSEKRSRFQTKFNKSSAKVFQVPSETRRKTFYCRNLAESLYITYFFFRMDQKVISRQFGINSHLSYFFKQSGTMYDMEV